LRRVVLRDEGNEEGNEEGKDEDKDEGKVETPLSSESLRPARLDWLLNYSKVKRKFVDYWRSLPDRTPAESLEVPAGMSITRERVELFGTR